MDKLEKKTKFVDCSSCESKVGAEVLASSHISDEDSGMELEVYLLKCPICGLPICAVAEQDLIVEEDDNDEPQAFWSEEALERVWPYPKKNFFELPNSIKQSLEEAEKCFGAKAHLACSVMCRRTLEALCADFGLHDRSLPNNLQGLKTKGIIDGKLWEWGNTLREMGNIGAHVNKGHISKQDAQDIMDFTIAICEYVYTLTGKYEKFKSRQKKQQSQSIPKQDGAIGEQKKV